MQPLEALQSDQKDHQKNHSPGDIVFAIGNDMKRVSPGDLATLRRTAQTPMRNAWFWHWKNTFNWHDAQNETWAYIIAFMAIMTEKGRDKEKPSLHDAKNKLGKALWDGGEEKAPPRPKISEQRLARLLNARGDKRREAMLRIARMLAKNATPLNCEDVAWFLLREQSDKPAETIAKAYYSRKYDASKQNVEKSGDNDQYPLYPNPYPA